MASPPRPSAVAAPSRTRADAPPRRSHRAPLNRFLRSVRSAPRALLWLMVVAIVLRLVEMIVYSTVVLDYYPGDVGRFIRFGYSGVFEDEWQPAGYALFLAGIRSVVDWLPLTVAIQHALGVATGLLLYATARRAGARPGFAVVPAALVLLSGDLLFLEQTLLTETLWLTTLAGALYACVRAADGANVRWLAAGSTLLGLSIIVRNLSMPLPVLLALSAALLAGAPLARRARAAVVAAVPAFAVVAVYALVAGSLGSHSGLGEMSGWSLYERVGQFADCHRFTPPDGTEGLCEERPAAERPGPYFYYFEPTAPARKVFPAMSPEEDDEVGAFARAAILHQPVDYARTVAKDVVRYFDPNAGVPRLLSGSGPEAMSFRQKPWAPESTAALAQRIESRYDGLDPTPNTGTAFLESYQAIFRLNGLVLLALFALSALGAWRARGRARQACFTCLAAAVVLLVLPPMVSSYDARYAIPPAALLGVSAALGLQALWARAAAPPRA